MSFNIHYFLYLVLGSHVLFCGFVDLKYTYANADGLVECIFVVSCVIILQFQI